MKTTVKRGLILRFVGISGNFTENRIYFQITAASSHSILLYFQKREMQCQLHYRLYLQLVLRGRQGCVRLQEECTWPYAAGESSDAGLLFLWTDSLFQLYKQRKTSFFRVGHQVPLIGTLAPRWELSLFYG